MLMYKFYDFLKKQMILEADALGGTPPPPTGASGLGPPMPAGGGMSPPMGGGMPPPMGGGLGGGMGGLGGGMPSMGGGPSGAPTGNSAVTKLKTTNVWDVLDKLLNN